MKIVSLNVWGGRMKEEIDAFFRNHTDTDVFFLQEVFHNGTDKTVWDESEHATLFSHIESILSDHTGYFSPVQDNEWGLAMFVKKSILVNETRDVFVHRYKDALEGRDGSTLGRCVQILSGTSAGTSYALCNFHGLWTGKDKLDTETRLEQSKNIVKSLVGHQGKRILGGDFNLRPDTESVRIIEQQGNFRNLIREYNIQSTRTSLYTKSDRFADYIFVSPDIEVLKFAVLPDEVSDHAALYTHVA
jgi:exonuclease III